MLIVFIFQKQKLQNNFEKRQKMEKKGKLVLLLLKKLLLIVLEFAIFLI